jgi:hypothetical protein
MINGYLANAKDMPFASTFGERSEFSFDAPVCVSPLDVRGTLFILFDLKLDRMFFLLSHVV